jgi:hypothetical protein
MNGKRKAHEGPVAQGGQLGTQVEAKKRVHKSPQPAWTPPCMVVTDSGTAQVPP